MTIFEFMQNAFFMLCAVACIAVDFLIIYIAISVAIRGIADGKKKKEKSNGRNQN